MKNVIQRIPISRIRKHEFRDLVDKVVGFVEMYDPATLGVNEMYQSLLLRQQELQKLRVRSGSHPITAELQTCGEQRNQLIRSILGQFKALQTASNVFDVPKLDQVASFVNRYLNGLLPCNSTEKSDRIWEMLTMLDKDADLQVALNSLNLTSHFNELREKQNAFKKLQKDRSDSMALNESVDTKSIVEATVMALNNLLNEIELAQLKNTTLDYKPLINNLNQCFAYYSSLLKTRKTLNEKDVKNKTAIEITAKSPSIAV